MWQRSLSVLVLAAVAASLFSSTAVAHGIRDQVNDDYPAAWSSCKGNGRDTEWVGQTFVPADPNLLAVELPMGWNWGGGTSPPSLPVDTTLSLDVRADGPEGRVLASGSLRLPSPGGLYERFRAHFDLTPPLRNVAGRSLYFEVGIPVDTRPYNMTALWVRTREGDPYPAGRSWTCNPQGPGTPRVIPLPPDEDLNFITFSDGSGPAMCPQIAGRVPQPLVDHYLANPERLGGYFELAFPSRPEGPHNRRRTWLTLRRLAVPYHPTFNGPVWRARCP